MRKVVVLLIIFSFLGYFLYQARGFILGPQIIINTPQEGELLERTYLLVKGKVLNTSSLVLNGQPVAINEDNLFEQGLLLASGYNIIEMTATDIFGREVKEKRVVVVE